MITIYVEERQKNNKIYDILESKVENKQRKEGKQTKWSKYNKQNKVVNK